ncbi:aminotransferase class V-fold PLP-dependent enzyme [Fonticella tunisiensis]|uniref:Selenocysteine lyase/cysteine desulfurase n=1 Tax=Fonticella tunisiensis TaxID=1096341 RepID=A0A4R7KWL1_9CLOT|nr:aminotransferase class V-fold PLP-dependent enzyme [Fonticella tunisiensis]TDT63360.1 selenocysteine lyase/cysteine desulfurase [Fonticella tunisiensis]
MNFYNYDQDLRKLVVGVDTKIPLIDGSFVTAINFDNAATTPPFVSVLDKVYRFCPWYSSVHRGTGYKSQISSNLFDVSRKIILDFVNGDPNHDTVIYVKNTTEAINKLAYRLCRETKECVVLSTDMEHHSNDLPWRNKYKIDYVNIDSNGRLSLEDMEEKLQKYMGKVRLLTIAGASNVTGHINPIYRAAELAHKYNTKILVDGAQLVPHAKMDMRPVESPQHIDYLVFSAHKMYAPFGIGVLIGPRETFAYGEPDYSGGGTVKIVTHDFVDWDAPPEKEEAGTPNLIGIVALIEAIKTIKDVGMERIEAHERNLLKYAVTGLKGIGGIRLYGDCEENFSEKVAIIPFNVEGLHHETVAKILSYEAGIAVRNGCFCAQPYIQKLLKVNKDEIGAYMRDRSIPKPGMVRLSFGLYNTFGEIDRLIRALDYITRNKKAYDEKYKRINVRLNEDFLYTVSYNME